MKKILLFSTLVFIFSCKKNEFQQAKNAVESTVSNALNSNENSYVKINENKNTIKTRFSPLDDYTWVETEHNSYGNFIENFKLKNFGEPIIKYNGEKVSNQNNHLAVFDIDVGSKDLQQCADAIIRLRSEYLFKTKSFGEIKYHFTSGDLLSWNDFKNGTRAFMSGNSVTFRKTAAADDSYENFRNYLDLIYNYAGTISQFKETQPVNKTSDLKTGDILITAGSPGHVVFIAGVSKNSEGKKLFLLGEGFTPAQSISIMKNPFNPKISPWYDLDANADEIKTSRYFFKPVSFRRYE